LELTVQDLRPTADLSSTEQRADVVESETVKAVDAPQPLDPKLLQQIGGGVTTNLPGSGW
jgi:hypothetical protein